MIKHSMLFVSFIVCIALSEPELKGTPTELTSYLSDIPVTVSISSEGIIYAEADNVKISVTITTEDESFEKSIVLNKQIKNNVRQKLIASGIKQKDIYSSKFESIPQVGIFSAKVKKYKIENKVEFRVENEDQFLAIAKLIDGNKEISYNGVEFTNLNIDSLKNCAIKKAIDNAKTKKDLYEASLNISLIPKQISETYQMPSIYATGETASLSKMRSYETKSEEDTGTNSDFNRLTYKANVIITYQVKTKSN